MPTIQELQNMKIKELIKELKKRDKEEDVWVSWYTYPNNPQPVVSAAAFELEGLNISEQPQILEPVEY